MRCYSHDAGAGFQLLMPALLAMTDEIKAAWMSWLTEFLKQVGFPIAVAGACMWVCYVQLQAITAQQADLVVWVRDKFSITVENNTAAMRALETCNKETLEVNGEHRDALKKLDETLTRLRGQ